jgi:hypothetical protein
VLQAHRGAETALAQALLHAGEHVGRAVTHRQSRVPRDANGVGREDRVALVRDIRPGVAESEFQGWACLLSNGMLEVRVPSPRAATPRMIEVKAA